MIPSPPSPPSADHDADRSGTLVPIWHTDTESLRRSAPSTDLTADVVIVGAGIAGLTAAYHLLRQGKSVIVVDEKPVGGGETGRTSAHLASALDDRFHELESMHGLDNVKLLYNSHAAAIDEIERIARTESIQCDFARVDAFLFAGDEVPRDKLEKEFDAARRALVRDVSFVEDPQLRSMSSRPCIRFPHQAVFHPLRYLRSLASAVEKLGGKIHTGVRVMDLSGDGPVIAKLQSGQFIRAQFGFAATNIPTPINNWTGIYTKEMPYRTFILGFETAPGAFNDALYWDMVDPYHYVRLIHEENRDILLVGGEDHKTGQPDEHSEIPHFARLEAWARAWFPAIGNIVTRWSGQVSEPDDGVAFIGRVPTRGHSACFVITGDSGMGLTHGTLGAMLITDLILGRSNPWAEIYSPDRRPWKAAGEFIKENVNTAAQFTDYFKPSQVRSVEEIERDSGAIVRDGLSLLAVYRDEQNQLHACSAICPHLKGVVRWNDAEKSWDCPCHGSRFTCKGKLIMGPSIDDLKPSEVPKTASEEPQRA